MTARGSTAPRLRILDLAVAELPCRTRLPFRFGAVTVTAAPLLHLRAEVATEGGVRASGMASDLLVPKWFRKDVDRTPAADHAALRQSVRDAAAIFRTGGDRTVHAHWARVQHARVDSEPPEHPELLERGYGIALIERAVMDALCRAIGEPFPNALRNDLFGRGSALPAVPPSVRIAVRHTVGRLDPLRTAEIAAAERLDDGLPQALDEVLAVHGVRWLKIKIGGGTEADADRLAAIGALLDEHGSADVAVTLDGNEQFADFAELDELWRRTAASASGRSLLARVHWIEQPLPRQRSRSRTPGAWSHTPLVLDEADAQSTTFARSGYDGVSVKNCKGVLRALGNRDLVATSGGTRFQSSEDLTNLPVLALQQDLCLAACLGLPHSERNGHHYFPGLDHLPAAVVDAAVAAHPELYERSGPGARLRIDHGELQTAALLATPGFGVAQAVVDALARALSWQPL